MAEQANADINLQVMQQLGEVQGQLANITLLIQNSHSQTNKRIDDLNVAVTARLDNMDERLQRVEANERSTAIKAGAVGAVTSAVVTGAIQLLKHSLGA